MVKMFSPTARLLPLSNSVAVEKPKAGPISTVALFSSRLKVKTNQPPSAGRVKPQETVGQKMGMGTVLHHVGYLLDELLVQKQSVW